MLHLCSLFLYCSAYSWFLTVFLCLSSRQTLKPLVFSYFHHLLQPAVHWRPIHLVMPEVTDALRNHHTAERTKDNITSRNSREKYNCNPRQGLTWQTLDHKPLLSEKENNCHTHKKIWHNQRQKRVIICGLPFLFGSLPPPYPPPRRFYIGAIYLPRPKRSSWEKGLSQVSSFIQ